MTPPSKTATAVDDGEIYRGPLLQTRLALRVCGIIWLRPWIFLFVVSCARKKKIVRFVFFFSFFHDENDTKSGDGKTVAALCCETTHAAVLLWG